MVNDVNVELVRRQQGYGRGRRMQIEKDSIEFLAGVRAGETLGSPIAMLIHNRDWKNWQSIMFCSSRSVRGISYKSSHAAWRPATFVG